MNTDLERITQITGAFDKRHPDPSKNYGIHGMSIRFNLKGPKGSVQFLVYTSMHLSHVHDELRCMANRRGYDPFKPMGADIGYHAYAPQYEGQTAMEDCDILGCDCYYDGSGLRADEFMPEFLSGGSDAVWSMLEEEYKIRFGG